MKSTLTRRIAYVEQFELLVGVDIGKKRNVALKMDRQFQIKGRRAFGNSRESYAKLVGWLGIDVGSSSPKVLIGLEPTNDYWQWIVRYLSEAGIPYRLVNPFAVKQSRSATQLDFAKDDDRDALTIAHVLRNGQYTETQQQEGVYAELRNYSQAHYRLGQSLTKEKTILRQYAERLFPEASQICKDIDGKAIRAVLKNHANPAEIASHTWEEFLAEVRTDYDGSRLQVSKVRELYEAAPESIGVKDGGALQELLRIQQERVANLHQQQERIEAQILELFHQLPYASNLLSIGLGKVTTALIIAEIGNPDHFRNGNQLVKLAGMVPTPKQSGQMNRQRTPMSHKGRPRLRTYLYFACLHLLRQDEAFQERYQHLCSRPEPPMTKMQAIGALMCRLLRILWALIRNQCNYQPASVNA
ncbi:IS110 family transposase [Chloroflexi bacterium TSY]|nr:IS110 family transposase [Chloroflexi bacterium TSY]